MGDQTHPIFSALKPLVVVFVTLPDVGANEKVIGLDRSRLETANSRNLNILLDIIKAKLPGQPIAKFNREGAIAKSWKSIAELWQSQDTKRSPKLEQSAIEK